MENGRSGIFKASDSARVIRDVGVCFFTDQKKNSLHYPKGWITKVGVGMKVIRELKQNTWMANRT